MQVHAQHLSTKLISTRSGVIESYSLHGTDGHGRPFHVGTVTRANKGQQGPVMILRGDYDESAMLQAFNKAVAAAGARRFFSFTY